MADNIPGDSFTSIGAAGVTLITGKTAALRTINILGTGNGTLAIYNVATAGGTAAGNLIMTVAFLGANVPTTMPVNINCNNGIVTTVTGTIVAGVTYS